MKKYLENLLSHKAKPGTWKAILITALVSLGLTLWVIYGIGQYGLALFVITPLFIGSTPVLILGYREKITKNEARRLAFFTLSLFAGGLVIFAIEGLLCLVMAAPLAFVLTWAGSLLGYAMIKAAPGNALKTILILVVCIPAMAYLEKGLDRSLSSVVTSIEIQATPQEVWKNVIQFPKLDLPKELIFKTGIAYPLSAEIRGKGVGAIRYCNFSTGRFVEPITVWNEPMHLKFDVTEQPEPLQEISIWKVHSPHLQHYFVSRQGQFKLTELPNGHTLLEGTTWYYLKIRPAFYWHRWSGYIIQRIHLRVLEHIKLNAESESKSAI